MAGPQSLASISNPYWKLGVMGPPGCGKSIFAGGSRKRRTFVFDVDEGLNSVLSWRVKNGMDLNSVTVWAIDGPAEFDKALTWLRANLKYYDLVVIDSVTELQRKIIKEIRDQSKLPTLDEKRWGLVRNITEELFFGFRHMPVHVAYTMHEVNKIDPNVQRTKWRPSFDGRTGFEYAKHLSLICRYSLFWGQGPPGQDGKPTQQVIRALNFGPDPDIDFKDRSNSMSQWETPDIDYILDKACASTTTQPL